MASITIRNLDEETKRKLRIRAAQQNRSMEEEARHILNAALAEELPAPHLADRVRERFQKWGGVELPRIEREQIRLSPDFGEDDPPRHERSLRNHEASS